MLLYGSIHIPKIIKMGLKGMALKLETKIGILIVVARANGLDYAFTQGEDIILAAMAHHCPKLNLLGDEREKTIQNKVKLNLFLPLPLKKGGVNLEPINNLKKHPLLVIFGYLPSIMASRLSLEFRTSIHSSIGSVTRSKNIDLPSLGDGVYVCD